MIERRLGKALWSEGIRYRKQYRHVPGRPDFAIVWARIAIFCDSSFWHGRDWSNAAKKIKTNRDFWIRKIERNIARDREVKRLLSMQGWSCLRFWDDRILAAPEKCAARVVALLKRSRRKR